MVYLYGVPTCKKIVNTKDLLVKNKIEFEFINVKKAPLSEKKLQTIVDALGLDKVLNSTGPMFRKLGLKDKNMTKRELFFELLNEQGMITRPLIEQNGKYHIGYDTDKIITFLKS